MTNSGPEGFQRYREGQSESVAGLCQVIEDILQVLFCLDVAQL